MKRKCRADRWVSGERQFGLRREYPNIRIRSVRPRHNEYCFGKVKLLGDGLHPLGGHTVPFRKHCQRIAAKWLIAENIKREKGMFLAGHGFNH